MSNLPVKQDQSIMIVKPQDQINEAADMARILKEVVTKAGLSRRLGGRKEHLEYEAWATIARWFNATPITEWTRPIKDGEKIIGWEARVNVVDSTGRVIGSSEGMCMSDEPNWRGKPSYALRSMAQTRTAGKALRSLFAHIAVLAGYAATPAEEMDGVETKPEPQKQEEPTKPEPTPESPPKPADEATPAQKKKLFAMANERFGDREIGLRFIKWALEESGQEYWSKKLISDFFDQFDEQAGIFESLQN